MNKYYFNLNIKYQSFVAHYSGAASQVMVVTHNGLKLQLPAVKFRSFLTHQGVVGSFCLETDSNNKFVKIERLN